MVTATTGDSIGGSNPFTRFMVEAANYGTSEWGSWPDSGYSVDNLPPVAPAPFTGHFDAGAGSYLTWGPNAESDLAGYRLYRGDYPGFTPAPGNLVYQGTLPNYHDVTTHDAAYKVCAYDIHGNEGPCAMVTPSGSVGVEGSALPKELALSLTSAIPARSAVEFRLALPRASHVDLAIYDTQGRLVRDLAGGWREAGVHPVRWDLRDQAGEAVPSGVYFARLGAGGLERLRRIVTVR